MTKLLSNERRIIMNKQSNKPSANRRMSFIIGGLAVAVVVLCASCAKPFLKMEVRPLQVCGGDLVEVEWKTKAFSTTTLASNPTVSGLPKTVSGDHSATDNFEVEVTTTFSLKGQTPNVLEEVSKTVTIVPAEGASITLEFTPNCNSGYPVWETAVLPEEYAGTLTITTVLNLMDDREVRVTHAGKKKPVGAITASTEWNGDPLVGSWEAETDLLEDLTSIESCGEPGTIVPGGTKVIKPPPTLKLLVSYECP